MEWRLPPSRGGVQGLPDWQDQPKQHTTRTAHLGGYARTRPGHRLVASAITHAIRLAERVDPDGAAFRHLLRAANAHARGLRQRKRQAQA